MIRGIMQLNCQFWKNPHNSLNYSYFNVDFSAKNINSSLYLLYLCSCETSVMFILLNYLTVFIFNLTYPNYEQMYFTINELIYITVLKIFINLNAIFLLGAIAFKKTPPFYTTLITAVSALGVYIIISILFQLLKEYYYSAEIPYLNSKSFFMMYENNFALKILNHLLLYGFAIFFWYVGYLKLKEKEV